MNPCLELYLLNRQNAWCLQLCRLEMTPLLNKHYQNEGSLSGEKIPKCAFKLFLKLNPFAPVSGLSNEILCTLVAQETAKLPNVKVGGLKKILPLGPICTTRVWHGFESQISFHISNFELWYLGSPLSCKCENYLI